MPGAYQNMVMPNQAASTDVTLPEITLDPTPTSIDDVATLIWRLLRYAPDKTAMPNTLNASFEDEAVADPTITL